MNMMQRCGLADIEYINPYTHTARFFLSTLMNMMRRCGDAEMQTYTHTAMFLFNIDEHDAEMWSCRLEYINPYNHIIRHAYLFK